MEGIIGPDHPGGSAPNSSAHQEAFQRLSRTYPTTFVRGHLLNHELGGPGDARNLYPITSLANRHHDEYVEEQVKEWVNDDLAYVYYKVEVDRSPGQQGGDELDADFVCTAWPIAINAQGATIPAPGATAISNKRIASRAGGQGGAIDRRRQYPRGTALVEQPGSVVIEYARGRLPAEFKMFDDDAMDLLDNVIAKLDHYYNRDRARYNVMEPLLQQRLLYGSGIGWGEWEIIVYFQRNQRLRAREQKATWNRLVRLATADKLLELLGELPHLWKDAYKDQRRSQTTRSRKKTNPPRRYSPSRGK
jgi:hypothetical protein